MRPRTPALTPSRYPVRRPGPGSPGGPARTGAGWEPGSTDPEREVAVIGSADIREWRGQSVVDEKGRRIGTLESVYVETASDAPFFATVTVGVPTRKKLVFVPLDGAVVGPTYVRVAFARSQVKGAPSIGTDDVLPAEDEPAVFAHYALAYTPGSGGERRLARR